MNGHWSPPPIVTRMSTGFGELAGEELWSEVDVELVHHLHHFAVDVLSGGGARGECAMGVAGGALK